MALMAMPSVGEAKNSAGQTFRIKARVPVACWVRPNRDITAQDGSAGTVVEACNSPGGYIVQAHYRPLLEGETARMVYGESTLNLSPTGGQELRRSNMATIRNVAYRFDNVAIDSPLTLHLTIQPI